MSERVDEREGEMTMTYRLITFDVFSALGDIRGTFVPKLNELDVFVGKDARAFFDLWRAKQYEYMVVFNSLEREFMSFLDITRRTLDYALSRYEIELASTTKDELVEMWGEIEFWEEARRVVQKVKEKGYEIAMLSNGGEALLQRLADRFGVEFDYIFSAEHVGKYKPSPKMYALPYETLALKPGEYLHVAGSTTDVFGAIASNTPCAWSNRNRDILLDIEMKPTYELKNLIELLTYI